jgi:hypothetical protein
MRLEGLGKLKKIQLPHRESNPRHFIHHKSRSKSPDIEPVALQ